MRQRTVRWRLVEAVVFPLWLVVAPSYASTIFDVGGAGSWENSHNWSLGLPGPTDSAFIDGAAGHPAAVTLLQNETIGALTIDTNAGGANVLALGLYDLTLGNAAATNNIDAGTLTAAGGSLDAHGAFNNGGTLSLAGGGLNAFGAFNNTGTLSTSGNSLIQFGANLTNSGTMVHDSSTIGYYGNVSNSGSLTLQNATSAYGGLTSGTTFDNPGTLTLTGGSTLNLANFAPIDSSGRLNYGTYEINDGSFIRYAGSDIVDNYGAITLRNDAPAAVAGFSGGFYNTATGNGLNTLTANHGSLTLDSTGGTENLILNTNNFDNQGTLTLQSGRTPGYSGGWVSELSVGGNFMSVDGQGNLLHGTYVFDGFTTYLNYSGNVGIVNNYANITYRNVGVIEPQNFYPGEIDGGFLATGAPAGTGGLNALVTNYGQLTLAGTRLIPDGDFDNKGSLTLQGGGVLFMASGSLLAIDQSGNLTHGTWEFDDGGTLQYSNTDARGPSQPDIVANHGTIILRNDGVIQGYTDLGIKVGGGFYNISTGNGLNTLRSNFGSLTLDNTRLYTDGQFDNVGTVNLKNGALLSAGSNLAALNNSGNLNYGTYILTGASQLEYSGVDIYSNAGNITLGGTGVPGANSLFINDSGDQGAHDALSGSFGLNYGTFTLENVDSLTLTQGPFINAGTLSVLSGSGLGISGSGNYYDNYFGKTYVDGKGGTGGPSVLGVASDYYNNDGYTSVTNGAAINVGGSLHNNGGTIYINGGQMFVNGGLMSVDSSGNLASGSYDVENGGVLSYYGNSIVTNNASITLAGSGTILNNGSDALASSFQVNQGSFTLTNTGSGGARETLTAGSFTNYGSIGVYGGSSLTVAGVFDNRGGATTEVGNGSAVTTNGFTNEGSVLIDGGFTYLAQGGKLQINGGDFLNFGSVVIGAGSNSGLGGTLEVAAGHQYQQWSGTTDVEGTLIADSVEINGGSVYGKGTIEAEVDVNAGGVLGDPILGIPDISHDRIVIHQHATLNLADPGPVDVASADLEGITMVYIDSDASYDSLDASGLLTLGGTLDLIFENGFLPDGSEPFDLFTSAIAGDVQGSFSDIELYTLVGDQLDPLSGFDASVGTDSAGDFVVSFTSTATPEPGTWGLLVTALGAGMILGRRKRRSGSMPRPHDPTTNPSCLSHRQDPIRESRS